MLCGDWQSAKNKTHDGNEQSKTIETHILRVQNREYYIKRMLMLSSYKGSLLYNRAEVAIKTNIQAFML